MANSIEMASIDDQILRIPLIEKDEIEKGSKVDHSININQIFDENFKNLDNSIDESCTIFKVNVWLRESNPDAYKPKIVSIGPYHKRDVQLHRMEKYKILYLRRFLGRKEGLDAESCIKELEGLKEEALKYYNDVETDEFCRMLLLDGCFVVEFIRECYRMCAEDNIINDNIVGYIVRDLLFLENQLPFFILDKLHDMTKGDGELALVLLASVILHSVLVKFPEPTTETFLEIGGGNIKHLLHLLHILSCPAYPMKETNYDHHWYMVMPNATQLSEAGVRFDIHRHGTSIFDIMFENGLMSIPQFIVTGDTETLLRNLIAYEQQSADVQPKHFSDFAIYMDSLIKSHKDVTLLRRKKIIAMKMGTEKQVANLFNQIASGVTVSADFYYNEEIRKAVAYYENHKIWAGFVHYFFKNYLTQASTLVAFIALIFTFIQTILAYTGPLRK